jgi:hypothetical protein
MAIVIVDEPETVISHFIGDRPEPIIRRGTVDKTPHGALGLDPLGVGLRVPVTHRLDIGETGVHRLHVVLAELPQAQPRRHQDRMRDRLLRHFVTAGSWLHAAFMHPRFNVGGFASVGVERPTEHARGFKGCPPTDRRES